MFFFTPNPMFPFCRFAIEPIRCNDSRDLLQKIWRCRLLGNRIEPSFWLVMQAKLHATLLGTLSVSALIDK